MDYRSSRMFVVPAHRNDRSCQRCRPCEPNVTPQRQHQALEFACDTIEHHVNRLSFAIPQILSSEEFTLAQKIEACVYVRQLNNHDKAYQTLLADAVSLACTSSVQLFFVVSVIV